MEGPGWALVAILGGRMRKVSSFSCGSQDVVSVVLEAASHLKPEDARVRYVAILVLSQ